MTNEWGLPRADGSYARWGLPYPATNGELNDETDRRANESWRENEAPVFGDMESERDKRQDEEDSQ